MHNSTFALIVQQSLSQICVRHTVAWIRCQLGTKLTALPGSALALCDGAYGLQHTR